MTRFAKWIQKSSPQRRVAKVAARSLEQRIEAVSHFLALAAAKSKADVEYVHQLRIWARRATAVVDLYGDLLPERRVEWASRQLKRVRKAANDARDLDVLLARLSHDGSIPPQSELLDQIRQRRRAAQRPIKKVAKRLVASGKLERRLSKMLEALARTARDQCDDARFDEWSAAQLHPIVDRFLRAAVSDHTDFEELHQFRICGKELRYAMELTAGAFPAEFRTQLYPKIVNLLERLGQVNDRATAQAHFRQWLETAERSEAHYLEALLEAETEQLVQAHSDFLDWWTPNRVAELRVEFERWLGKQTPAGSMSTPLPGSHTGSNGKQGEPNRKETMRENVVRKDQAAP